MPSSNKASLTGPDIPHKLEPRMARKIPHKRMRFNALAPFCADWISLASQHDHQLILRLANNYTRLPGQRRQTRSFSNP